MNADGSDQKRLTEHDGDDYISGFSPDGAKIVFRSNRDGNWQIYTMNIDGSDQRNLTANDADNSGSSYAPILSSNSTSSN